MSRIYTENSLAQLTQNVVNNTNRGDKKTVKKTCKLDLVVLHLSRSRVSGSLDIWPDFWNGPYTKAKDTSNVPNIHSDGKHLYLIDYIYLIPRNITVITGN